MSRDHTYQVKIIWTGNKGQGTTDYRAYERAHSIIVEGKPELLCSSDPAFRGDAKKWNPEELLLASLSSCHMLWYLHLCADRGIVVIAYQDQPTAKMKIEASGAGGFVEATLFPTITITDPQQITLAHSLHPIAHEKCFIANSVRFPIEIKPMIQVG